MNSALEVAFGFNRALWTLRTYGARLYGKFAVVQRCAQEHLEKTTQAEGALSDERLEVTFRPVAVHRA